MKKKKKGGGKRGNVNMLGEGDYVVVIISQWFIEEWIEGVTQ